MAVKRAGAAGALAAAMAAAVVLLSVPAEARASALGLLRERRVAADFSTYPVQFVAVHPTWPRRPASPDTVGLAAAVELVLALSALAVAFTPRAFPVVRTFRPVVRGPPTRAA
jgi:hypothetical protein